MAQRLDAPEATSWSSVTPVELAHYVGLIGRIQTLTLTPERRDALRLSVGGGLSDSVTNLADFCPDPLVLAGDSGLPRVSLLDRVVDGGSEWEQFVDVEPGSLVSVSRIAEIVERISSAGRRMIRTCYETEFRDTRGTQVGIARGFSIDVEKTG